jgi:hypothetical protein
MAEIIVVWILGLVVIAIGWGVIDRIAVPLKAYTQSLRSLEETKRVEIVVASVLALAVFSIMQTAADANSLRERADLPALLIWAGGIWLIPFRLDAAGHFLFSSLGIAVIAVLLWIGSLSYTSTRTPAQADVATQRGQNTNVTGLAFLFLIVLIGLTVAAMA